MKIDIRLSDSNIPSILLVLELDNFIFIFTILENIFIY